MRGDSPGRPATLDALRTCRRCGRRSGGLELGFCRDCGYPVFAGFCISMELDADGSWTDQLCGDVLVGHGFHLGKTIRLGPPAVLG